MSFFSRLSDIISCNVNDLLTNAADPLGAVREIVSEMEQGLAGARRSAHSAANAEERLRTEIGEYRAQVTVWIGRARDELAHGRENEARRALLRKRELEDLLAGLQQQHAAAVSTRDQLATTLRAIEARLAEARRKQQSLESQAESQHSTPSRERPSAASPSEPATSTALDRTRAAQVEAELDALRREMQQGG